MKRGLGVGGVAGIVMIVLGGGSAWAQVPGPGGLPRSTGSLAGYGSAASSTFGGGGSSYLPLGRMGGFVPYSPGPGGGLGVQPGMGNNLAGMSRSREGMKMLGQSPELGSGRGRVAPLVPIGILGGMRGGRGGMSGGLIPRAPAGGAMRGMSRPPVGFYPFRIPPSLVGPSSGPAMSM